MHWLASLPGWALLQATRRACDTLRVEREASRKSDSLESLEPSSSELPELSLGSLPEGLVSALPFFFLCFLLFFFLFFFLLLFFGRLRPFFSFFFLCPLSAASSESLREGLGSRAPFGVSASRNLAFFALWPLVASGGFPLLPGLASGSFPRLSAAGFGLLSLSFLCRVRALLRSAS